jgi:hypothetical protein
MNTERFHTWFRQGASFAAVAIGGFLSLATSDCNHYVSREAQLDVALEPSGVALVHVAFTGDFLVVHSKTPINVYTSSGEALRVAPYARAADSDRTDITLGVAGAGGTVSEPFESSADPDPSPESRGEFEALQTHEATGSMGTTFSLENSSTHDLRLVSIDGAVTKLTLSAEVFVQQDSCEGDPEIEIGVKLEALE